MVQILNRSWTDGLFGGYGLELVLLPWPGRLTVRMWSGLSVSTLSYRSVAKNVVYPSCRSRLVANTADVNMLSAIHYERLCGGGSRCPYCDLKFGSRPRLLQHMSHDKPSCGATLMERKPLLLPGDIVRDLDARDRLVSRASRRAGLPERLALVPVFVGPAEAQGPMARAPEHGADVEAVV